MKRLVFAVLVLAGCHFDAAAGTALVTCTAAADCPPGQACVLSLGYCVAPSDSAQPVTLSATVSPSEGGPQTDFIVSVDADTALLGPPRTTVSRLGAASLELVASTTSAPWRFRVPRDALRESGRRSIEVVGVTKTGSQGRALASFVVDALAPEVRSVDLALAPVSPIEHPTALGTSGSARLTLSFSEPIAQARVTATPPGWLDVRPLDGGVFELRPPALAPAGGSALVTLNVEASDAFDNTSSHAVVSLTVDLQPPSAPSALEWRRAPVGSMSAAGPHFEAAGHSDPSTLIELSEASGASLGQVQSSATGDFVVQAPPTDRAQVWLQAFDEAGNHSERVPTSSQRLTLVPNSAVGALTAVGSTGLGPVRNDAQTVDPTLVAQADTRSATLRGTHSFRALSSDEENAANDAVVQDELAGLMHIVGGSSSAGASHGLTSYNGVRRIDRPSPNARYDGVAAAIDRQRNVLVVFGVEGTAVDEFDGQWSRVASGAEGPASRKEAVLVEAPVGVLLLGGLNGALRQNDAWLWNRLQTGWQRLDAGAMPLVEVSAAYDPSRRRTLIVAGDGQTAPQTWAFDGRSFARLSTTGAPPSAVGPMGYDAETDTFFFAARLDGGANAAAWSMNGQAWRFERALPGGGRLSEAGGWFSTKQELVLAGQDATPRYTPRDGGWQVGSLSSAGTRTGPDGYGPAAYDEETERVVSAGHGPGYVYSYAEWSADAGWTFTPTSIEPHFMEPLVDGGTFIRDEWTTYQRRGTTWVSLHAGGTPSAPLPGPILTFNTPQYPDPLRPIGVRINDRFTTLNQARHWRLDPSVGWVDTGPSAIVTTWLREPGVLHVPRAPWFFLVGGRRPNGAMQVPYLGSFNSAGVISWAPQAKQPLLARYGLNSAWHPVEQCFYVQGGRDEQDAQRADVSRVEAFPDGGLHATPVTLSDPEADGDPDISRNAAFGWSTWLNRLVLHRGEVDVGGSSQSWVFDGPTQRPALTARFDVGRRLDPSSTVTGFSVRIVGTGSGVEREGSAVTQTGLRVSVWAGYWKVLGQCTTSPCDVSLAGPTALSALLAPTEQLFIRVEPLGVNGIGTATLDIDALEVQLSL